MTLPDGTRPVRPGEELPMERLEPWLRAALDAPHGAIEVAQYPAGHSNLTYAVRVGDRTVVLRRPPFGSEVATAHDMAREHRILTALHPSWGKVPRPLALCDDESVLGAPFYLMEALSGVVVRRDVPDGMGVDETGARRLSEHLVDTLTELHALDPEDVGLGGLGRPEGYVARQVAGWSRRYERARTDDIPEMEAVAAWLAASQPPEAGRAAPIHNDFKYDNVVIALADPADPADPGRVEGVLDWEMATVGDPLMDLGTVLSYWTDPGDPPAVQRFRAGPTTLPGSLDRRGVAARYAEATGADLDRLDFYYAFGLFKTAVIGQQIYARFAAGHTQDPRFGALIHAVRALAALALDATRGEGP